MSFAVEELARLIWYTGCLQLNGPYQWASGIISPFKFDMPRLLESRIAPRLVGTLLARELAIVTHDAIIGVPSGGHGFALAANNCLAHPSSGFEVEKSDDLIPVIEGLKVAVIEDAMSTGGSTQKLIDRIDASGGKVVKVLTVLDHQLGGSRSIRATGIPVISLLTGHELIDVWDRDLPLPSMITRSIREFYDLNQIR